MPDDRVDRPDAHTIRRLAPRALVVALALGLVADQLFFGQRFGLNWFVFVAALLGAMTALAWRAGRPTTLAATLLGALALLFAAGTVWRDAPALIALDVLALLTVFGALVPAMRHGAALPFERAGPLDYAAGLVVTGVRVAFGLPQLAARAAESAPGRATSTVAGLGTAARGALLAAPVLLVFGLLLASADPTFNRLLDRLFGWYGGLVAEHALFIGFCTWVVGGLLYAAVLDRRPARDAAHPGPVANAVVAGRARLRGARIGTREVTVALALIDVLLVTFGALQARWLFGGAAALETAGVTVATYARSGFFELVTVAALTLPLLLVAHGIATEPRAADDATTAREAQHAQRHFRIAAGTLIALVLVLLLSAADRMHLYLDAFGLTEQRYYASIIMLWLGAVLVWAAVTLLRDRAASFALGVAVSAWLFVLALHVVNPDARIANVNLTRAAAGLELDAEYLRGLSADAAPALAQRAPAILATHPDAAVRCALRAAMHAVALRSDASPDWRGWRLSHARARRVLPAWTQASPAPCAADTVTTSR